MYNEQNLQQIDMEWGFPWVDADVWLGVKETITLLSYIKWKVSYLDFI